MYAFHYDFKKKIVNDFKLLFTDTDSLCYEICDENTYEKFMSIGNILIQVITLKIVNIFVMIIKRYSVKWKKNMVEILLQSF